MSKEDFFNLDDLAGACIDAEIPDSLYESLCISLRSRSGVTKASANKVAEEDYDFAVWKGQIARRESIAKNHDAMIILTQSYPADAVVRVVDAHTERNVIAAIAADRASRQVANKAEVEPSRPTDIAARLRARAAGSMTNQDDAKLMVTAADECDRFYGGMMAWKQTAEKKDRDWNEERMARVNERCVARATPPATTGASTAPIDGDRLYVAWHKVGADVAGLKFADFMAALGPVGASTVLTDERIGSLYSTMTGHNLCKKDMEACISFARAIEREVAAKAGQVAPAQPLAMVSPSELRDIQAGRGGVPVRGNQWRADQTVPIYAAPVAGQVAVPETKGNLDLSGITSVLLQDRGSKSVIVRFGQSIAAATKFLDQFGTLVLSQRAAQLDGGQEVKHG